MCSVNHFLSYNLLIYSYLPMSLFISDSTFTRNVILF